MIKNLLYIAIMTSFVSCRSGNEQVEKPLVTVIKLQSAETLGNFEEAKRYIELDKVYSEFANDTLTAENAWKNVTDFGRALSRDKKFTNVFTYFDYTIKEITNSSNAQVIFEARDSDAKLKSITYHLELDSSGWKVVGIDYDRVKL